MKSLGRQAAYLLLAAVAFSGLVGANLNSRAGEATNSPSQVASASGAHLASVQPTIPSANKPSSADDQAKPAFPEKALPAKVLFVTSKDSPNCDKVLGQLMRPNGDFEKMRAAGWKIGKGAGNQLQIVDKEEVPDLIKQLGKQEFPTVASVDKSGEVVRYFRFGCTTPLDMWTFGFLAKGIDERPKGFVMEAAKVDWTGHYPLRGNHWSVEGNWSPTKEETVTHLHGPNHQSQLIPEWHIEQWSLEELRSLHDDLHEKYDTGTYRGPDDSGGTGGGQDYLRFKGKS